MNSPPTELEIILKYADCSKKGLVSKLYVIETVEKTVEIKNS